MAPLFKILAGLLLLVSGVLAHPGHAVADEAAERTQIMKRSPKSPRECASTPQAREYYQSAIKRRHELADKLRTEHSLTDTTPMLSRLDFADYGSSHASRKEASSIEDTSKLFADSSSCILQPEVTAGPYYVDGELIRPSIADGQEGVPLWVDIHLIDASTCEPMQGVYIDFWHCNATGVNSGVSAEGNGSSDVDTSNLDATFGRGIQQTNEEGVVQFSTIFPGHYAGRTSHIHLLTHSPLAAVITPDNTLLSTDSVTHASHVGQIFFDQELIDLVESTSPYTSNEQALTLNADDGVLAAEAEGSDPFVEYFFLGEDVRDGVFAWVSVGIDPSMEREVEAAGTWGEGDAVVVEE